MTQKLVSEGYPSYSATSTAFTPGATPQDVFTLTGSATTQVYVLHMSISTIQTTAGTNAWFLAKRSTANSGGTAATPTIVPLTSTNGAATAVARQYTANPTAGTLVGYNWGSWINSPTVATAGIGGSQVTEAIQLETDLGQAVHLADETEVLGFNFKGAALPAGLSVIAHVEWIEVPKS
jgi:hypothetical protein